MQIIFAQRSAENAREKQPADSAIATWRDIDVALSPIIGSRGVTALFKRTLYLARTHYPALLGVHEAAIISGEFIALHSALLQQTNKDAVIINNHLLDTFCGLLTHFIGESLTRRLLQSIFDSPFKSYPAQSMAL